MKKPLIIIPMGDPAGIGPEIVIKTIADDSVRDVANCLVVGDLQVLKLATAYPGSPHIALRVVENPEGCDWSETDTLYLMDLANVDVDAFSPGIISGMCGRASFEYIERSAKLAMDGLADAVATPPINKESFNAGGIPYIGHTEAYAALSGTPDPLTLFQTYALRIFFLTRHIPLSKVSESITFDRLVDYGRRCTAALRRLGVKDGVMAVAGLNPHSGEHGLFGDEEDRVIRPAIEALRIEGYDVVGPVGADSVFSLALKGYYNSVLSLYHDQGHIAAKTLDFDRTVSITAGMPFLRTSVDHGTAFDIAGRGIADKTSLCEAVRLAAHYAPAYREGAG
ncbi:MAG: 4-hydroxythreonine-4-phosphate dehydrogenase PdxA [Peptococcaceae bacterium]|nr:4-hydroxythreonine-4-phosphate dehydrogenase PdxA [Peptococcaceae bacterium]